MSPHAFAAPSAAADPPDPDTAQKGRALLGTGAGRVRRAMYTAFAVIAGAVVATGMVNLRLEDARTIDAALQEQVLDQHAWVQLTGRLGALMWADPAARTRHADALGALLARSRQEALDLQTLLRQRRAVSGGGSGVDGELERWEAARERLWYRVEALLRDGGERRDADLPAHVAALQAEVEPALAAAQALSARVNGLAASRHRALLRDAGIAIAALLLLLLLLSLAVVEPAARAIRRHGRKLHSQTQDLQRLALVAEHTTALVLITDAADRLVWVNAAFSERAGWPLAEALGRRPDELMGHPLADEAARLRTQQALRDGLRLRVEWLRRNRAGSDLWLMVDLCPLRDDEGRLTGYVRVCTDVTARAHQQAKLQALWAVLPAGVVVQGIDGEILEANRTAERLLGLSLAQLQGRSSLDPRWRTVRTDGSDYPGSEHPAMRTLATGQALRNETMGVHTADGQLRWLMINTEPQLDPQGVVTGVVACFSDMTESRTLQDRLSTSARTDALTSLPNRAVVMERLQHALDHLRRHPGYGFAVLFMDFDRFKQVNDTLGHGAGDELLRQIAQRLSEAVRPGDAVARVDPLHSVAARLGGDEFVVVLDGVADEAAVQVVAQRLLVELSEPYTLGQCTPVQSTASIGIVLCKGPLPADDGTTAETLLRNADTAMYEAKRAGRGRCVMFNDAMHERLVRALSVETDLRRALKADELFVVYQPVVDLASSAMVGVEALVRWRHPQRGLISPVEFIGIAEECGLIDAIGALVLGKSCAQFMQWQLELGPAAPRQLAVNLSRAQIDRDGVVDEVAEVLRACAMAPEQLQLEVTESLAAQGTRVQANLRALKSLGVRLALDDFGTGYSSLACLHQLPVDTVKVDRSFVQHAETVEYHRVLIEATIRVARTLGMTTVAEGIETPGQAALMLQMDCDRGQGYLYSRPLEAPQLASWALSQAAPSRAQGLTVAA